MKVLMSVYVSWQNRSVMVGALCMILPFGSSDAFRKLQKLCWKRLKKELARCLDGSKCLPLTSTAWARLAATSWAIIVKKCVEQLAQTHQTRSKHKVDNAQTAFYCLQSLLCCSSETSFKRSGSTNAHLTGHSPCQRLRLEWYLCFSILSSLASCERGGFVFARPTVNTIDWAIKRNSWSGHML